jgi:hypothetical protein
MAAYTGTRVASFPQAGIAVYRATVAAADGAGPHTVTHDLPAAIFPSGAPRVYAVVVSSASNSNTQSVNVKTVDTSAITFVLSGAPVGGTTVDVFFLVGP